MFKASVLYHDQLPIQNCLEILSQKIKRKSLGGNSFSWMILWSWKHLPEAAFSLPRINLAPVLQLPARDGASQNQPGVFQLISVPALHLHLTPSLHPPPFSPVTRSERLLGPQVCGLSSGPACLLGAQVQRFLKNKGLST